MYEHVVYGCGVSDHIHIIIYFECKGGIKNLSQGVLFGIKGLAKCCQMVILREGFIYPIHTQIMDFFLTSKPTEIFSYL